MSFVESHIAALLGNTVVTPSQEFAEELAVIARIRGALTPQDAVALASFAFGRDGAQVTDSIRAAGSELIARWPEPNEAVCRRLAGATLISLWDHSVSDSAVAAALASASATRIGWRPVVTHVSSRSKSALIEMADQRRRIQLQKPAVVRGVSGLPLPPNDETTPTNAQLRKFLSDIRSHITEAGTHSSTRLQELELLALRNSEEIELLWWTLAPDSVDLPDWERAGIAATLVAGFETGRRMLIQPPARGVTFLLRRALTAAGLDADESSKLSELVDAMPSLSAGLVAPEGSDWSFPVLTAICAASGRESAPTDLNATHLEWANQLVNEMALAKLLGR
jgi:hypothetical protein